MILIYIEYMYLLGVFSALDCGLGMQTMIRKLPTKKASNFSWQFLDDAFSCWLVDSKLVIYLK